MADAGAPERAKTHWGRFFVTLIVGGALTAIVFILDGWWLGTVLLLLTLFAACFSFSPVAYPTVFTLYAMFAIGWLSGAWLDGALHRGDPGDGWWRDALPFLGGFLIGVAVPAVFWFVTFVISTKWVLGVAESHDIGWWKAFVFVATRAFGYARPYVQVDNGKMRVGSERDLLDQSTEPGLLAQFGGPGTLVVGEGNVVVLEQGGKLSRILGQGTYALRHNEWFKKPIETKGIHDLRGGGGDPVEVDQVLTEDGVPLDITIGGSARLELKSDTDKRPASRFADAEASSRVIAPDSQFPIYEETIRKAVYKTGNSGWKTAFPGGAADALRDVVANYTLDQIFGMPGADQELNSDKRVVKQIEDQVKEAIGENPSSKGLVFNGISIKKIEMPKDVRRAMVERWAAPIRRDVKLKEAETKRLEMVVESRGRAELIQRVEEARMASSDKWVGIIESLRNVLPEMENERVALQFVSVVRELLGRIGESETADQKRLNRLQRFLADEDRYVATSLEPSGYLAAPSLISGDTTLEEDAQEDQES